MEDYVTYEQAVKLKELGFDYLCNHYYNDRKELVENFPSFSEEFNTYEEDTSYEDLNTDRFLVLDSDAIYSAPTLAQAAKWLREVKEIRIYVLYSAFLKRWYYQTNLASINKKGDSYDTYEKALSAGIDKSLELLIKD